MPKFYRCVRPWARHSIGEVIPEHEYNKLPHEIKQHKNFELIDDTIQMIDPGISEKEAITPIVYNEPEVQIQITTDIFNEQPTIKKHRYDRTSTKSND